MPTDAELRREAVASGLALLLKPVDPNRLRAAIRTAAVTSAAQPGHFGRGRP